MDVVLSRRQRGDIASPSLLDTIDEKSAQGKLLHAIARLSDAVGSKVRLYIPDTSIEAALVAAGVNTWPAGQIQAFRTRMTKLGNTIGSTTLGELNVYASNRGGKGGRKGKTTAMSPNRWVVAATPDPGTYNFTSNQQVEFENDVRVHVELVSQYHEAKSWAKKTAGVHGVSAMPGWLPFLHKLREHHPAMFFGSTGE